MNEPLRAFEMYNTLYFEGSIIRAPLKLHILFQDKNKMSILSPLRVRQNRSFISLWQVQLWVTYSYTWHVPILQGRIQENQIYKQTWYAITKRWQEHYILFKQCWRIWKFLWSFTFWISRHIFVNLTGRINTSCLYCDF